MSVGARIFPFRQSDLDNDEIAGAFEALDAGAKGGMLNPMQFSNLLRMMDASQGNLKLELDLFHAFDSQKNGALTLEDFQNGIHKLVADKGFEDPMVRTGFISGIRARLAHSPWEPVMTQPVASLAQVMAIIRGIRAYHEKGMVAL